jgi:hypothetical protein
VNRSVAPKSKAANDFMEYKERFFPTTVWSEDCNSWYKLKDSKRVAALWVGSTVHYLRAVEQPRYEDWDFDYNYRNPWAYLGNGLGPDDVDENADLAWYIRNEDDSPILGTKRVYSDKIYRGQSVIGVNDEGGRTATSVESKLWCDA